jgi:hypothetical protein
VKALHTAVPSRAEVAQISYSKGTAMKTHISAITLAIVSSGAFAQTGYDNMFKQRTGPTQVITSSTLSREAVRADLLAAIVRGERFPDFQASHTGPTQVAGMSPLTREEVRADLLAAIDRGERFPDLQANRTGPTWVASPSLPTGADFSAGLTAPRAGS